MRRKQKRVDINTFGCSVLIMLCDDIYSSEMYLHKKYGYDKPKKDDTNEGLTVSVNFNLYAIIVEQRSLSHNLIAHEVCHVVHRITQDREIVDEETMAWLTGFISEEFYKFIKKVNKDDAVNNPVLP